MKMGNLNWSTGNQSIIIILKYIYFFGKQKFKIRLSDWWWKLDDSANEKY